MIKLLSILMITLFLCGCAHIEDAIKDRKESEQVRAVDAVDYSLLQWSYGGFNGTIAKLDVPRLSNLTCNGRRVGYTWDVGLEAWGQSHTQHTGQICAVFIKRDGVWVGGKFDWVSTSRCFRDLYHLETYNSWPRSGITLPLAKGTEVAFVVVYKDGSKRSNVVYARVQ